MAIELEKIKPWDGQSGTGADNRGVIDRNFEKVKTELEAIDTKFSDVEDEIVQLAGEVSQLKDEKVSRDEMGINLIESGYNILQNLENSDIENSDIWGIGYFHENGSIVNSSGWRYSKDFIRAFPGIYNCIIGISGNACIIAYDAEFNFISAIKNPNTTPPISSAFDISLPENTKYIKISVNSAYPNPTSPLYAKTTEENIDTTNSVFETPSGANQKIAESKTTIINEVDEKFSKIGIDDIPTGYNILQNLENSDIENSDIWGIGYFHENGSIVNSSGWRYSKDFIKAFPGLYNCAIWLGGNACIIAYDADFNFIASIANPNTEPPISYTFNISLPENTAYIRVSTTISVENPTFPLSAKTTEENIDITNDVFETPSGVNQKIAESKTTIINEVNEKFSKFGLDVIPIGTNFVEELTNSDLTDTEIWATGFLRGDGTINTSENWLHTVKYYSIPAGGSYRLVARISGNASVLIYDENKFVISVITNPSGIVLDTQLNLPENARYIRESYQGNQEGLLSLLLTNNEEIYVNNLSTEDISTEVIPAGTNFVEELTNSNLADTEIWAPGFLTYYGSIAVIGDWFHSVKYYPIPSGGSYRILARVSGNAKVLIYDVNKFVIQVIGDDIVGGALDVDVVLHENARFIRESYQGSQEGVAGLKLINNTDILVNNQSIELTNAIGINNTSTAVSGYAVANNIITTYKLQNPAKPRIPIVSFISDDGRWGNDEWYIPILDSKNVKSSFAVVTGWFDNGDAFSRQRVKELYDLGHDIAGHTNQHRSMINLVNNYGIEELDNDLMLCKTSLMSLGIDSPMFIAPFGERSTETDRIVRRYFETDFITSIWGTSVEDGTAINLPPLDRYLINRVSFDSYPNMDLRIEYLKDAVDACVNTNGWLIFAIHPHYPEYSETHNPSGYQQRRNELIELIDYIQSLGIPILTAKEAYNIWKNPVDVGNIRLDEKYYSLGMDGTEAGTLFG